MHAALQHAVVGARAPRVGAAVFDGTNDYATRGSALTGIADGKEGVISAWVRPAVNGTALSIFTITNAVSQLLLLEKDAADGVRIACRNAAGVSIIMDSRSADNSCKVASGWTHVVAAWNLAAGTQQLYLNDASNITITTNTNDTIDYSPVTSPDTSIAARVFAGTPSQLFNGMIAELWFHTTYMDISILPIRRRFINSNLTPAFLGADGSKPLGGTVPLVYCRVKNGEDAAAIVTNRGSGGGFTLTGALDNTLSTPSVVGA